MSGYLLAIIGIVLLTGILSAVLPEGKTAKFIKGMTKLCCLAVILAPILGFFHKVATGGEINFPVFFLGNSHRNGQFLHRLLQYEKSRNAEGGFGRKKWRSSFPSAWKPRCFGSIVARLPEGGEDGYLSVYEGTEIKITKVLLKDIEGNIDEEVREKMKEHITDKYGCEVEFVE